MRWDAERGVWYADLVVDPGLVYEPFISLALARRQPVPVSGAHLSAIVQAEFAQLAPDRLVTVTPRERRRVEVAVLGIAHPRSGAAPGGGTDAAPAFDITVQRPPATRRTNSAG